MSFDFKKSVIETELPLPCHRGKVRDVYDAGQNLIIVSTDRISAFDWVLPAGIPGKGIVLNQLSRFWFDRLQVPHHMVSTDLPQSLPVGDAPRRMLAGRTMVTKKAQVIPFECVVRGYLEGSGWQEYQAQGSVCGVELPSGLQQCDPLPEPIFTPATKAAQGHDENVSFQRMENDLGSELAERLRHLSLDVYRQGSQWARQQGIIIADTKFEFGWYDGQVILIDEVLTPDSSRFWPADQYQPGSSQPSFDKQFVRQWLIQSGWDRNSPPPTLPTEVIQRTQEKYVHAYQMLTGQTLPGWSDAATNPVLADSGQQLPSCRS
ncbi:MAG: phosphoribosylaminoimidazolesuccinocarboxamide synthase [Pirellulaceae bacterium]|nr:phosphoribosylaminoimidazolesuccinocarboxamide synthase [Pirellulaceae bacterium]